MFLVIAPKRAMPSAPWCSRARRIVSIPTGPGWSGTRHAEAAYSGPMPARPSQRRPGVPRPPRRHTSSRASYTQSSNLPVVGETSAGGLVVNVADGVPFAAVIARRNRGGRIEWCLPKGHLEGAETAEEAALREVREETGITGRIIRHLATIDYWFSGPDRRVHKVVHHFLMGYLAGEVTVEDDPDHEAEEARWLALRDLPHTLVYPNERRIAGIALDLLYRDS